MQTQIPEKLYFRIRDAAEIVGVKPYVLRYWETEFPVISPEKSKTGQRVYRRSDIENLLLIKHLLYKERYSIEGARNRIRELRKTGELKEFREGEVIGPVAGAPDGTVGGAQSAMNAEEKKRRQARIRRIQDLTRELRLLSQKPIQSIFKI